MKPLVLIITNRFDSHADFVIERLEKSNVRFVRLNTDDVPIRSSLLFNWLGPNREASLRYYGQEIDLRSVTSVWFRRPLGFGVSDKVKDAESRRFAEDECSACIEGVYASIPGSMWMSHPHSIRRAQNKLLQLGVAQDLGFIIPRTVVTTDSEVFRHFWDECRGEVIWKAIGRNTTIDETGQMQFAYTNKLDASSWSQLNQIAVAPCLFQEYVPKEIELRVTVVDQLVFACAIHSQLSEKTRIDWRHYDTEHTPHVPYSLPPEIERLCVRLVRELGLRFGAIDLILTPSAEYKFIEINPNGQWLWIEQLSGLPIADAVISALTRVII